MAFQRRRFSGSRRMARRRRQGAWNGDLFLQTAIPTATTTLFELWSPAVSQALNVPGHCVHQRSFITIMPNIYSAGATAGAFAWAWYVMVGPTQNTGALITSTQLWFSPFDTNQSSWQKEVLHRGMRRNYGAGGAITPQQNGDTGVRLELDLKAKRRMSDTEMLVLAVEHTDGEDVPFDVYYRTYCSW